MTEQDEYTTDTQAEYEPQYDVEDHAVGSLLVSTLVYRRDYVLYEFAFKDESYRTYDEHHYAPGYEIAEAPIAPKHTLEDIP